MRTPKLAALLAPALLTLALLALGQESETPGNRIITIDSSGGTQRSADLRYGPITFEHPEPEGLVATVSNLTIFAQRATLAAPEGVLIAQAQGQRTATFEGGVRVTRGRLEAKGPDLIYSEVTGLGLLTGGADVVIAPEDEGDDPVFITADEVEFDVDTDRSLSRGNVALQNGNQQAEADELLFAEEQSLGKLSSADGQAQITRTDEDGSELLIIADEIRVLTESKRLYARGNVTVVDGSITSRGDTVFFDDEQSIAEVIGSPAVSVDEENGVRLESDRIRQDIEFDFFEAIDASVPSDFDPSDFVFEGEETVGAEVGQEASAARGP